MFCFNQGWYILKAVNFTLFEEIIAKQRKQVCRSWTAAMLIEPNNNEFKLITEGSIEFYLADI